jgi:DUF1009 family protein
MTKIGLVAGSGSLPAVFADKAKARGDTVVAFCLKGVTDGKLEGHVDKAHWFDWGDFKKAVLVLASERVKKIILLGKIKKDLIFKEERKLDGDAKKILKAAKDKRDYSILKSVSKTLAAFGVEILDSTTYMDDLIPSKGVLTRALPAAKELEDIEYGTRIAREMSGRDIGQAVVVKDRTVICVEGVEGTDAAIKRAGELTGGGFVVVKVARPDQDMRLDVPVVGSETMRTLIEAGGRCLAMEGSKMFLLDRPEVVRLADANNISVIVI